jgi:hypothetical protein
MRKYIFIFYFIIIYNTVVAQTDYSWWNDIHNWDGHTSWVQYMTMSTSFMGPNALPVPELTNGRIDSLAELELAGDYYHSEGDKTTDFYLRGSLPLYDNRVSFSVDVIPYEWFKMDTVTRDERAARTQSGEGGAGGDIYFYSSIQLVRNKEHLPDIMFRAALRTASGTNLGNARFTDAAGYFFDISAGKNYSFKKNILRPYILCGFYSYQTYDLNHSQNDCLLYGIGADIHFRKIILSQSLAGYSGYLNIGDKPMVYRLSLRFINKMFDWKFSYQAGLNDYEYQKFRVSLIFHLSADKIFRK